MEMGKVGNGNKENQGNRDAKVEFRIQHSHQCFKDKLKKYVISVWLN